jgi:hypothetical protein
VFSVGKDRHPDLRGKFRIILRQIPEMRGGPGNAGPNGSALMPPSEREAVADRAPNGSGKKGTPNHAEIHGRGPPAPRYYIKRIM